MMSYFEPSLREILEEQDLVGGNEDKIRIRLWISNLRYWFPVPNKRDLVLSDLIEIVEEMSDG